MQVSITHARRCLLHMHAGVYDTCTQVSMILACRCLLHLLASHHSSEGNSDRYAVVYDTCTQVSMTTARRCLWHLHADPHNTHFHDYLIHSEDDDHNDSILSFLYICLSLACRSKLSFCTYLPSSTTDWVSCNKEMADHFTATWFLLFVSHQTIQIIHKFTIAPKNRDKPS